MLKEEVNFMRFLLKFIFLYKESDNSGYDSAKTKPSFSMNNLEKFTQNK